jgi:hypothetical protein
MKKATLFQLINIPVPVRRDPWSKPRDFFHFLLLDRPAKAAISKEFPVFSAQTGNLEPD